jgi:cytochrome c oxidase subunit III
MIAEHPHLASVHHPQQQHHFDTMEQQYQSSSLGMWVFLIQEIMFFGGLFVAYLVYRHKYFDGFGVASSTLRWELGIFNTFVLIGSSLTMALAVNAAQRGLRKRLMTFIVGTMILGSIFLGVKVIEYTEKFEKREVPGANFCFEPQGAPCANVNEHHEGTFELIKRYASGNIGIPKAVPSDLEGATGRTESTAEGTHGVEQPQGRIRDVSESNPGSNERQRSKPGTEIYYSLYFAMTGMHALHMIIGMGLMVWLLWNAYKGLYSTSYFTPVENFGLYWHFVDIVWIYLFPLLYLINRHIGAH